MKNLGPLHYLFGFEAHYHSNDTLLSQAKYVDGLLHKFDLFKIKHVSTFQASNILLFATMVRFFLLQRCIDKWLVLYSICP